MGGVCALLTANSPSILPEQLDQGDSSDEADVPDLTPSALAFSRLPPLDWPQIMQAISADPSLLSEETGDALLVEAFSCAMKGTKAGEKRARDCVEKALVGQYCRSLGRDGVALFFQRSVAAHFDSVETVSRLVESLKFGPLDLAG